MENLILLIVSLVIMLFILFFLTGRDILSPALIMIQAFLLSTFFALMNVENWNIVYSIKSYYILISGILVFSMIYIFIYYLRNKKGHIECERINSRIINIDTWKIILTIIINIIILYFYQCEIIDLVNQTGYKGNSIAWQYRNATSYEGIASISGIMRLLIKFVDATAYIYIFIFINNVIISKSKIKKNIPYMIPSVIFSIKTFISGGRLDILKLIAFSFIASYFIKNQKEGWSKSYSIKYILIGIISVMIVLPLFYYSFSLAGRSTTRSLYVSISTYAGGSIQHFNQYVQDPINKSSIFGNETLIPILNMLNKLKIIDYHNTVHLEYRKLGVTRGNIYTFFRRPLQDYGLIGMYIFTASVSMFFSIFYLFYVKYRKVSLRNDLITILYTYLLYWIVLSSIEQYSISIISIQTLLTILTIILYWMFCFCIQYKDGIIIINKWKNIKNDLN